MSSLLKRLSDWYETNCDGDWEHGYGVKIDTLDNPGWSIEVDLKNTHLEDTDFQPAEYQYDHDTDWLRCWKSGAKFEGRGGPQMLEKMIGIFLDWAEKNAR